MINLNQFIGYNLYQIRTQNNLTLEEFANIFNITTKEISSYEEGESDISFSFICEISKHFDIEIGNLLPCSNKNNHNAELIQTLQGS